MKKADAQPGSGSALDHIGFSFLFKQGAEREVHHRARPLKLASGTMVNYAYIEGPAGAKVELVQR